jgi:hypothetical protein
MNKATRGTSAKETEVFDHVHLIEIPEMMSDVHPGLLARTFQIDSPPKSSHASECFRRHSDLGCKLPPIIADAHCRFVGDVGDSQGLVGRKQQVHSGHNRRQRADVSDEL